MKRSKRILSCVFAFAIVLNLISTLNVARAGVGDYLTYWPGTVWDWITGSSSEPLGGWTPVGALDALFSSNTPQKYYTTPTSSVQDKYGNVTNYYRGGDTTNTKIIDSYNKTFNTIHNTSNTTNNYQANVKLSDFLNSYTTNNVTNNNTYSANFKSWYYDNTTNNYNYTTFNKNDYTQNNLYYNQDNSRYYISIDNSTDEYYLIDVQYSPTFVTVNYTYNNTVNNEEVGDVTNVYYYELKDGRNSSTLTAAEVAGLDFGYDVANYVQVADDPNTLSLQHFDNDYNDSSVYGRSFYSQNRSMTYVDSGAFGKAVSLPSGSAAGVTIPGLSGYNDLSFDFRVYYNDISSLGIYFGDTNIFQEIATTPRNWVCRDVYTDDGLNLGSSVSNRRHVETTQQLTVGSYYTLDYITSITYIKTSVYVPLRSDTLKSQAAIPTSYRSPGYDGETSPPTRQYGWLSNADTPPSLYASEAYEDAKITLSRYSDPFFFTYGTVRHYAEKKYSWTPGQYAHADFSYDSYRNQWVSMRVTLSGGNIYYFVNGDLVGSGPFTRPAADKFYIKSSGTLYLDELRVTTGSLSSAAPYNPANAPYDTNKVLALPDVLKDHTIYVQHSTPVTTCRVGGVRPSNPSNGFLYIPLHADYTGGQPQLYVGGNWVDVTAMVRNGTTTVTALGYKFAPIGASPDVIDPDSCSHSWVEKDRIEATCTAAGSVKYACSKCSKTKEDSLSAPGHTWTETNRIPATCTAPGSVSNTCSRCQEVQVTAIPALGGAHIWQETSRTPATCIAAGSVVNTCSRCGDGKTTELPLAPNAHSWQETGRIDETCTASGSVTYTCSLCGQVKTETLPALGHDWQEPIIKAATCIQDGLKTTPCSRCDETILEPLPATDHSWQLIRTITTQYDEDGNMIQEGYVLYQCEYCKEQYRTADATIRPPAPGDHEDESLWDKLGNFLGSLFGGLIDLIGSVIGGILDGLTGLVTSALERLAQLVNLFGSFGEALGVLWTWLPPEIMAVFVAGVTVFVFVALLKLCFK